MKSKAVIFSEKNKTIKAFSEEYGNILFRRKDEFLADTMLFNVVNLVVEGKANQQVLSLVEAECIRQHSTIKEDITKYSIASSWAEMIDKLDMPKETYTLLENALEILNDSKEKDISYVINFQFLWRILYLLGIKPEIKNINSSEELYFSVEDMEFFKEKTSGNLIRLKGTSIAYIKKTQAIQMRESIILKYQQEEVMKLTYILYLIMEYHLNFKVNSIDKELFNN